MVARDIAEALLAHESDAHVRLSCDSLHPVFPLPSTNKSKTLLIVNDSTETTTDHLNGHLVNFIRSLDIPIPPAAQRDHLASIRFVDCTKQDGTHYWSRIGLNALSGSLRTISLVVA